MADETTPYVPTTDEVRNNFAFGAVTAAFVMPEQAKDINWPVDGVRPLVKNQFNLWLVSYEKQLRKKIADDIRRRSAGNKLMTFIERLEIVAKRVEHGS